MLTYQLSQVFCGIHLRAISQEVLKTFIHAFRNYTFKITTASPRGIWVNSLRASNAKLQHKTWSSSFQVMASCLISTKPLPKIIVCWFIVNWYQNRKKKCSSKSMPVYWDLGPLKYQKLLTQWGRGKMVAFSQMTFSNALIWMKNYEFWLKIHWTLFLRVQLTIFQHWFW